MTRLPGLLFVVDIKKEHLAIKEARILGIPVIGIVDTNSDPEEVDFPIAANDDSIHTVEVITKVIADAVLEGREVARARTAELTSAGEGSHKESDDDKKVHRQLRTRSKTAPKSEGAE